MAAEELFAKANEAFVDENYEDARDLYDQAISLDPNNANYLVKRAFCHIKLEDHADAVADTTRALQLEPGNVTALIRKGTACYHLHEYQTAQKAFEQARGLDPGNRQVQTWLQKCADQLPAAPAPTSTSTPTPAPAPVAAAAPAPTEAAAPRTAAMRVRHDWYQTATHVFVSIMLKHVNKDDVKIELTPRTLSADVRLPATGTSYNLELDLCQQIVPGESSWQVFGTKIEIKLRKEAAVKWATLEWTGEDDPAPKPMLAMPDTAPAPLPAPNPATKRGPRDWDKLVTEIKEDEKSEKLEGEAALNKLFQDIYANANEDTRRAMNKSFVESGGTVLSTNWQEIGAKPVECKPPEGMEAKTYTP